MGNDLIERLRSANRELIGAAKHHAAIAEAITALEAAREDGERYRHIRKDDSDGEVDVCVCRVKWNFSLGDQLTEYEILTAEEADAAIDRARGKE